MKGGHFSAKPWSDACERNKGPILQVLRTALGDSGHVLEIGSGTGQHAVWFGAALPNTTWQTSDLAVNHGGIRQWIDEAGLPNVLPPIELDVMWDPWPIAHTDAVFSANTAHIMSSRAVQAMFRGIGRILAPGGRFCLYGPFRYGGHHTSESNERFDAALRRENAHMGVRDFEALDTLAQATGLACIDDLPLPANNRLLVWTRHRDAARG
jgi:SAM-dependent methyltransferase